jgi:hypothetical protein
MKSLIELPATSLRWERYEAGLADFELTGRAGIYGTLTFLEADRSLARVRSAQGVWTLKHRGILAPAVTLREEGEPVDLATYHPHALRHGELQFQDGGSYDWVWLREQEGTGVFLDEGGKPIVRLQAHGGRDAHATVGFNRCDVSLSPALPSHSRSALLAAFGWYLILYDHLKHRDGATAMTTLGV